jgi:hypothetical protein
MNARIVPSNHEAAAALCERGQDCVTLNVWGFPMEVIYEYEEGEPPVMWGDNAHPGHPPEITIFAVYAGGVAGVGSANIVDALSSTKIARIQELIEDERL